MINHCFLLGPGYIQSTSSRLGLKNFHAPPVPYPPSRLSVLPPFFSTLLYVHFLFFPSSPPLTRQRPTRSHLPLLPFASLHEAKYLVSMQTQECSYRYRVPWCFLFAMILRNKPPYTYTHAYLSVARGHALTRIEQSRTKQMPPYPHASGRTVQIRPPHYTFKHASIHTQTFPPPVDIHLHTPAQTRTSSSTKLQRLFLHTHTHRAQ